MNETSEEETLEETELILAGMGFVNRPEHAFLRMILRPHDLRRFWRWRLSCRADRPVPLRVWASMYLNTHLDAAAFKAYKRKERHMLDQVYQAYMTTRIFCRCQLCKDIVKEHDQIRTELREKKVRRVLFG